LGGDLHDAADVLQDASRREEYLAALIEARKESFQRAVSAAIVPGKRLSDKELALFLEAAKELRLPEGEARKVVDALIGIARTDNPYSKYGVIKVADDPTSPNEFDLLCLDESVDDERLIHSQLDAQLKRAREFEQKSTRPEVKREARKRVEEFEAAGKILLSSPGRSRRRSEIAKTRGQKFTEEVRLVCHSGQPMEPDIVISQLANARRIRLSDSQARQIITQVTGFADYMGLLSQRKTPSLGHIAGLKMELPVDGDLAAATRQITIRNEGSGMLQGRIQPMCEWIAVKPGSIQTDGLQQVFVRVNPAALPRGVPAAGQISVETNGGSQTVTVEAMLGAGDAATNVNERICGALVYLLGTMFFPLGMVGVFVWQNRSRFLTLQAAQASVLGTFTAGLEISHSLATELCCGLGFLDWPLWLGFWGCVAIGLVCAVMSLLGRTIRIPVIIKHAERFAYQFGEDNLASGTRTA